MQVVAPVSLKDWFAEVVRGTLGFSPATTTPEPVHVLNGLLNACFAGGGRTKLATALVAKRYGRPPPAEDVVPLAAGAAPPVEVPSDPADLEVARDAIRRLLAADKAVFPSTQSFQVAHASMITH